jgi:hypothetical protein
MNFNFAVALAALGVGAAFKVANSARTAADYLFASLLPEQNKSTYTISSGQMIVRATMAGLVGMDSPYPPGGVIDLSTFLERTAKVANNVTLTEQALRELQAMLAQVQLSGGNTTDRMVDQALNFLNKVVIQPHLDTFEWLRGQCLHDTLNWTFNGINLTVAYGIPTANKLANRTGTAGYGGSASVFWADVRTLRKQLKGNVRAMIAHPDTIDMIRYNPINALATVNMAGDGGSGTVFTFRRLNTNGQFTQDVGDVVQLISYGKEAEVFDTANPGSTLKIPFEPRGRILAIGNNERNGFEIGQGGTEDPALAQALGYTHIAPTVEGGGAAGRWAQLFTPEFQPWQLQGRGVTNGLPVLEAPDKVAIASTDMV